VVSLNKSSQVGMEGKAFWERMQEYLKQRKQQLYLFLEVLSPLPTNLLELFFSFWL
jgi:hypothetical protein